MGKYTNEEIVKGIKERRRHVFLFLYSEYLPMIKNFILKNNGSEEEAEDLFQDSMIVIVKKINSNKLKLTSSFKTYFYAISKYLWYQKLEILQRFINVDGEEETWHSILDQEEYFDFEEEKLYQDHFSKLDPDCQKILQGYFEKKPFKEIADDLNFKQSYIKKLKFNCKEKLYYSIINDPIYMELMDLKKDKELNERLLKKYNSRRSENPSIKQARIRNENKKRNK